MSRKFYKSATISLFIITLWLCYAFFDYLIEDHNQMFEKLGLMFYYFYSILFGLAIGTVFLILRLTYFRKERSKKVNTNFFYVFSGIFNLYIVGCWMICISLNILDSKHKIGLYIIGNFILTVFISTDIYKFGRKQIEQY